VIFPGIHTGDRQIEGSQLLGVRSTDTFEEVIRIFHVKCPFLQLLPFGSESQNS
jgi:hypothetical protein